MEIKFEHYEKEHHAIIPELDDQRFYSEHAIKPELRGAFMEYGRYHGKRVTIIHKIRSKIDGFNMNKIFILYGRKKKFDILSCFWFDQNNIMLQGLYRGQYADIVIKAKTWEFIKENLYITNETV